MPQKRINAEFRINEKPTHHKDDFATLTLHLRLKDKHDSWLSTLSREVNMVWNFCNEHSYKVLQREYRFCSAYDLHHYLNGAGKEGLQLHSQTVQAIADEFVTRRKQFKKAKLKWRVSRGAKRSLGWIPFKQSAITYKNGQVHLAGKPLCLWDSYGLADYDLGSGSISQDSRGRWYLNITVKARRWPCNPDIERVANQAIPRVLAAEPEALHLDSQPNAEARKIIGIDLGLKDFLASSCGMKIEAQKIYRQTEEKLAIAQRANKLNRVRALHAQIGNQRKDFHHKLSTSLVSECSAIFIGNVNASGLAKTNMAKSVLDAGWSAFRTMLQYKCDSAGVWFSEVNESYSTQTCNHCHARTGPKGRAELNVRSWTCSECHTVHDRDINAGINIKMRGLQELGIEFLNKDIQADACHVKKLEKENAISNSHPQRAAVKMNKNGAPSAPRSRPDMAFLQRESPRLSA